MADAQQSQKEDPSMQKGLGFYIYRLSELVKYLSPDSLVTVLEQVGAKWVSFKISDGILSYNQIGGNDKVLLSYIEKLEEAKIMVGGWAYCYPAPTCKPNLEAAVIGERIEKLRLSFVDLDIEGEWKKPNVGGSIDKLLYIDTGLKFPIGLCSYRFPVMHPQINWARFLKNPSIKYVSPQLYWLGQSNPGEQIEQSLKQYRDLTDLPFVPIGCTFAQDGWEPTPDQLVQFIVACKGEALPAYGFYSLDWLVAHGRYDWLSAIAGHVIKPPEPPSPPLPEHIMTSNNINARTAPQLTDQSLVGVIAADKKLQVLGEEGNFYQVKIYISKKYCQPL
jgi:hypothetical protein